MRLRREVGDFTFDIDSETGACTIPKNLFPEQLVGQIIETGGNAFQVVTAVVGASGAATYTLVLGNGGHLTYTVATGEVTMANAG